jgi:CubicO group peptidase (beta-lactamase class C family)
MVAGMDLEMSRRRVLATAVPALVGSVMIGSCARTSRQSSTSTLPTDSAVPIAAAPEPAPPATVSSASSTLVEEIVVSESQPISSTSVAIPTMWSNADFGVLDEMISATSGEAVIIVEGHETIHEWYRTDETYARDVASAQKSMLSMLVGRAIAEGLFELDTLIDQLLGPDWTDHGDTSSITVRQLLTMTSGLDNDLNVIASPGAAWLYSDAFAQLFTVLARTTGRDLNDVAREWLFDPAGAQTAQFYDRPAGRFAPIGLRATARDLAAIGNFVLDEPSSIASWLAESFTPSQDLNLSYGYLWWLNGQASHLLPGQVQAPTSGPLIPTAPTDLVAALGKDDQKLYVSRELNLVVARLGGKAAARSRDALSSFDSELWALILELRG